MPLKFGDLTAKSAAIQTAKERRQIERKIYIAQECLKNCRTIPSPGSYIGEFPPVIQRLGLDACREAARREAAQRMRQKAAL